METSTMTAACVRGASRYDEKRFLAALFSFSVRGSAGSSAKFFSTARRFVESRRQ